MTHMYRKRDVNNKSSAVAEMGDRLATIDMGRKLRELYVPLWGAGSPSKAVVPCQNKIILKNFRPEPPPSVDRPKIILFQHGTTSKIILKNFILTWNHV